MSNCKQYPEICWGLRFVSLCNHAGLLLILLVSLLGSCARSGTAVSTDALPGNPQRSVDLDELSPPAGVDTTLWDSLKVELAAVLIQYDSLRHVSSPPASVTAASTLSFNAGNGRLEWGYYSPGDYDQNGQVNISDLTPIAIHIGKSASPGGFPADSIESVVDGDGNGEINIADITPIGVNFNAICEGYRVYMSADEGDYPQGNTAANGAGAMLAAEIPFSEAADTAGLRRQFSLPRGNLAEASYFWARPFQGNQEGTPSNSLLVQPGSNQVPVAQISASPQSGPVPLRVRYGAIGSSDVDGDIVSYDWDFDSNGEPEDSWLDPSSRDFYFYTPGEYSVTLRVTDDDGATGEKTIVINAQPGAEWHHELAVSTAFEKEQPFPGTRMGSFDLIEADGTPAVAYSLDDYINSGNLGVESVFFRRSANSKGDKWGSPILVDEVEYSAQRIDSVNLHSINGKPYLMYDVGWQIMSTVKYAKFAALAENSIGLNWPESNEIFSWDLYPNDRILSYKDKIVFFGGEAGGGGQQRLYFSQDANGTAWSVQFDPFPQLGEKWPSLAIVNDRLAYAFSDNISDNIYQLMYVRALDDSGLVWPSYPERIAPLELSARHPALVVSNGKPGIAYSDISLDTLKWIHASDSNGNEWGDSRILDAWTGGDQSILVFDGRPAILYTNYVMQEWRLIVANDPDGNSWSFPMSIESYTNGSTNTASKLQLIGGNLCFAWIQNADTEDHYGSNLIYSVYY